ncbi:MAG TPA: penicillin-binding protein 2 [Thermoanaerobaculia bacterium]|nr:penicillin-binding protein 2 [Thermoanaerobaculia bacterium]
MAVQRKRLIMLFAFLTAWGVVIVVRLVQIQIVRHPEYVTRAAKQQERTLSLTPVRGSILDAKGRILAESIDAHSIYADPQAIVDPAETSRKLAAVEGLTILPEGIERKLRGRGEFAWVARQVSPEVASSVRNLSLPGIYLLEEHRRSYPKKSLGANLLGYVGIDGEGLAGVEHAFDGFARGRAGKVTLLRDARRGMYLVGGEGANAAVDGQNLVLTIDQVVQFIAERALEGAIERTRAVGGSVIVMDPNDGAILAMASYPRFDPNRFRDFPSSSWRNRAVQDLYEPGSTFKIVTAAAGLEEGVVTPSQILDCGPGYIEIASFRIREHGGHAYGYLSFEDVVAHSSNVGTIRVALALGQRRLHHYVRRFGFGHQTGIGLPGEASGIIRDTEKWSLLSNAVISIGQEIAATPLQVLLAAAVIANGGKKVEPRILDRVLDHQGAVVHRPEAAAPEQIVSEKTAAVLNEILKSAVARGTGKNAALDDYVVAGKTGTAQKAVKGGYSSDKYVASFVGYVPADRPRLAILVVIEEPRGSHYGGVVAAPVFREVAAATLRYLRVPPSSPGRQIALPARALAELSQPDGESPGRPTRAVAGEVPDLLGLDARTAIARAAASGFSVRAEGAGIVLTQSPSPGPATSVRRIELSMSSSGERLR